LHFWGTIMDYSIVSIAGWVGSIAFALSGYLAGARKQLDAMGIFIVAILTANGGGAVRDVLIGKTPQVLQSNTPFLLVSAVVLAAWLLKLHRHTQLERHKLFVLSDAVGLVAFALTGASAGIAAGLPVFGVMALAFITASGGGMLRDALLRDMPAILSSDFYGTVALALAAALYGLHYFGQMSELNTALLFISALILRIIAYLRGWQLPRLKM
jgi:uncharacterized membrane protein YeiH